MSDTTKTPRAHAAMTTPHHDDSGSVSSPPKPRWYCLSIDGAATLCADQADAVAAALDADLAFPNCAPHRAVQMVELICLHAVEQQRSELALTVREWLEKTEWVQQTGVPAELGMHRADVLRARIDSLSGEILMMRDVLKEAYEVIATIDDESEMLYGLRNAISHAIAPHQRGADLFAEVGND